VWFEQVMFFVAAILALAGALGVVMIRNPFYSVLALVTHLFALALLFLLLQAQFIAAAQVVVYAGAVMVLYVFVVAYIGGSDEPLRPEGGLIGSFGPLFAVALGIELCIAILGTGLEAVDSRGPEVGAGFGSPGQIGSLLLQKFLIPFESASYLLLVAAVGAVVLARRRRGLEGLGEAEPGDGGTDAANRIGSAAGGRRG
jgi:NADH-quinone oxidoreductase subunit J